MYGFPENAALALGAAVRCGRTRARPRGSVLPLDPSARGTIRAVIDRALSSASGPVWLEPPDLAAILRAAGIDFAEARTLCVHEAPDAAEQMGFPLVAKVESAAIVHKSDVGGVITGLNSRSDVAEAVNVLAQRMKAAGAPLEKVLLQREIRGGVEALVGVTVDPVLGALVLCGLGGILVEALKDAAFRLTPVSDVDADEMISELRAGQLLDGYRGIARGDRQAFARIIQRVSSLADLVPELLELDLNPVKVLEAGKGAVAVDARMRIGRL